MIARQIMRNSRNQQKKHRDSKNTTDFIKHARGEVIFVRVFLFYVKEGEHMDEPYVVKGNCLIIHLDKELDHHLTEQLRSPVDEIIDRRGIRYVIMDFENKSFMDSSGIGFIMGRYKKIAPCKGKIYVANLGRGLERIFKIAGLYTITVEKDSVEAALCEAGGNV